MTGVNPGRHNIFDFLGRDKKTYMPELSSAYIGGASRSLKIGKFVLPLGKPVIRLLRKSQPFWKILGNKGIFSNIIRVPITFPPEKFNGLLLSGMCVPDLKGSQGTFTFYTTASNEAGKHTGGVRINLTRKGNKITSYISGPPNPISKKHEELRISFTIKIDNNDVQLNIDNKKYELKQGQYTDWIKLTFKAGFGIKITGICRFLLKQLEPEFEIYVTPINIDPEKAALPISHPKSYATYLSKLQGEYATLGLAEDTWALNEKVIDEKAFLEQCYDIHQERKNMFFTALERMDKGVVVCVFDITDRVQHTFLRFLDPDHPAIVGTNGEYKNVIEDLYKRMDEMVGKVLEKVDDKTVLIVMSDHGFKQFKRGINLNSWLYQNGYLHLKKGGDGSKEWLGDVDWSKTKAYSLGLAGIFLNLKGRESQGIVKPGAEAKNLKEELISKLNGLRDEEKDVVGIKEVFDSSKVLSGPYVENAHDLIIGYNPGYRACWDAVTGKVGAVVFSDNTKSWGSDHCIDPRQVPGVFFCNRKWNPTDPKIIDIAPTVLDLFGVSKPAYFDGNSIINS